MPVNLDIIHFIYILATVPEEHVGRVLKFLPNQRAYLGLTPILHSSLILAITLEEVRLPASRSCLGHFTPVESFFATDQDIWVWGVVSTSPLYFISFNLLSEILTRLFYSGPATKVRICPPKAVYWDQVVEGEENEEAGARQEEQQALVHGCHQPETRRPFTTFNL